MPWTPDYGVESYQPTPGIPSYYTTPTDPWAATYGVEGGAATSGVPASLASSGSSGGGFNLGSFLGLIGKLFGGASKGRADARVQEALIQQARDRNAVDLYGLQDRGAVDRYGIQERGTVDRYGINQRSILDALGLGEKGTMDRAGLELAQKSFQVNAPQTRAMTALMGDKFARGTNMTISHPRANIPTMSGGYTMDDLSPQMRQMGQTMLDQALAQQTAGDQPTAPPLANFMGNVLPPPAMTPTPAPPPLNIPGLPQASALDTFLNVAGGVGSAAGAAREINQYLQRYVPVVR